MLEGTIIGKRAYKKTGFFAYCVGIVEESNGATPYVIKLNNGTCIGVKENDIVICEDDKKIKILS